MKDEEGQVFIPCETRKVQLQIWRGTGKEGLEGKGRGIGEDARTISAPAIGEEGKHGDAGNGTLGPPERPRKERQEKDGLSVLRARSDNVEDAALDKTINR